MLSRFETAARTADLSGALLSGPRRIAVLHDARLAGAQLRLAVLFCADLRGADLSNASLIDTELYLANTFGYGHRKHLAEHAYQQTLAMLRARLATLAPRFARHGISIDVDVLADMRRHLVPPKKAPTRIGRAVAALESTLDDLSHTLKAA